MKNNLGSRDRTLISSLRNDGRAKLKKLSKSTGIPVSTVYNWINKQQPYIKRYTGLIDFDTIGCSVRAFIVLKTSNRAEIETYLSKSCEVNSLFRINNGYDFILEAIFCNLAQLEEFIDCLEVKFKICKKLTFYTLNEIKRENYMLEPDYSHLKSSVP